MKKLSVLDLYDNQITEIKNLSELNSLSKLYLSKNKIEDIKHLEFIVNKKKFFLNIYDNPFEQKYQIKLSDKNSDNHFEAIKTILKINYGKGATQLVTLPVKVLMLGNHSAGKSNLVNFITKNNKVGSTHVLGVVDYGSDKNNFGLPKAVFYDFGGQDFYHGIYRAFFGLEGLQIVVFNPEKTKNERTSDSASIPIYNYNLGYWLGQKKYAEESNEKPVPFYLVQSHAEKGGLELMNINSPSFEGLQKRFHLALMLDDELTDEQKKKLPIYNTDKEYFKNHFDNLLPTLNKPIKVQTWYVDFLEFIYDKKDKNYKYVTVESLLDKLNTRGTDDEILKKELLLKNILELMHNVGLVVYYKQIDNLQNIVWLNPEALIKHIQENVLHKDLLLQKAGVVAVYEFENEIVNDDKILAFLVAQKVVYLHKPNRADASKNEYIIPNYLPLADKKNGDVALFTFGINSPSFILKFKFFIPFGLINQMICFFGQQPDVKRFWRNQLLFTLNKEARVLIEISYETLSIEVSLQMLKESSNTKNEILLYLYTSIMMLYKGDHGEHIYNYQKHLNFETKETEISIKDEMKLRNIEYIQLVAKTDDVYISVDNKRFVSLKELVDLKSENYKINGYGLNDSKICITNVKEIPVYPFGIFINKKLNKMKKIFISYSKHDEDYKEEFRKHLVTLRDQNLIEDFNCKQIDLGADWDATIQREIDECDYLICLVSVDFLNTPYIRKYEVAKAIEKGKTLIPIIIKPCDWEDSEIGKFYATERGHTISLNKELFLRNEIRENTAIERAGFWTKIVKEFREKIFIK